MQKDDPNLIVLDCRPQSEFVKAHIPGAITVPLGGNFAIWTAYLVDGTNKKDRIVLVAEPGHEREAITRLSRTGIDCVDGFLAGGFEAWTHANYPSESSRILTYNSSQEFDTKVKGSRIIDVRNKGEWEAGILESAEL